METGSTPWPLWKQRIHEVIFEADTRAGRRFDLILIFLIVFGVILVAFESVDSIRAIYGTELRYLEWGVTFLFSAEYVLRLLCVRKPWNYAKSYYGVVDLLAILPTWLSLWMVGGQYLMVVRLLRLVRVFSVLKLGRYLREGRELKEALQDSIPKITVFLVLVLSIIVIVGALMFWIEGPEHGFTSLPLSIYWAIVTMTTVGYGDISPGTPLGQLLASVVMIMGYGIIAVPTGIVTAQMTRKRTSLSTQACPDCMAEGHDADAVFCRRCGAHLNP